MSLPNEASKHGTKHARSLNSALSIDDLVASPPQPSASKETTKTTVKMCSRHGGTTHRKQSRRVQATDRQPTQVHARDGVAQSNGHGQRGLARAAGLLPRDRTTHEHVLQLDLPQGQCAAIRHQQRSAVRLFRSDEKTNKCHIRSTTLSESTKQRYGPVSLARDRATIATQAQLSHGGWRRHELLSCDRGRVVVEHAQVALRDQHSQREVNTCIDSHGRGTSVRRDG